MKEVFDIAPATVKTLGVIATFGILLVVLLALFGYLAYASRHVRFTLSTDELQISGDLYARRIPRSALLPGEAARVDLGRTSPHALKWRTNGTGLPGYNAGWYRLKNREKALVFVTDRQRVIRIPTTKGYCLLLSPKDPDGFLRALHAGGRY